MPPSEDSRFAVFSNTTTWYGSLKFLSDNLVVSYSPFFSNANKINNKWYVTVRKSGVYISSFSGVRKNAFALQEKNIKRRKVCHLLFKTAWIFKLAPLARRVWTKKEMFITELIINILGFSVTLKQRAH